MEDSKALQLYQEVLSKTKSGRIKWEPSANESQYFAVMPGGFVLAIVETKERDSWGNEELQHVLVLRGDERELLRVTTEVDGASWSGLNELFEFARRQALRVDANVDRLLGELAKL
jgi:hypothetical protein